MKYIFIILIIFYYSYSQNIFCQNNLIPNSGFELEIQGRIPRCNYTHNLSSIPNVEIDEDILFWKNAFDAKSFFVKDYKKSSPDWHETGLQCTNNPFSNSRTIYLEEQKNLDYYYIDAIKTILLGNLNPVKNYLFRINYATGNRKTSISNAISSIPQITIYLTKYFNHWKTNWGNVILSFNMYPEPPSSNWVQHWIILNGSVINNYNFIFPDLNNIVIDCQQNHVYIDYVELSEICETPLLIENHSFFIPELPYKSASDLKAGYDVGNLYLKNGDVIVEQGGQTIFKAGNSISLQNGFKASMGSLFKATIESCNDLNHFKTYNNLNYINNKTYQIGNILIYDDRTEYISDSLLILNGLDNDTISFDEYLWIINDMDTINSKRLAYKFKNYGEYNIVLFVKDSLFNSYKFSKKYIYINQNKKIKYINESFSEFLIYPNPNKNGIFNISSDNLSNYHVIVIDIQGKIIYEKNNINDNNFIIDISTQNKGIYICKIISKDKVHTKKLVIH
ncbi:MAG: hypothetical protein Kow0079_16820 [Vicingaceae bacterium]